MSTRQKAVVLPTLPAEIHNKIIVEYLINLYHDRIASLHSTADKTRRAFGVGKDGKPDPSDPTRVRDKDLHEGPEHALESLHLNIDTEPTMPYIGPQKLHLVVTVDRWSLCSPYTTDVLRLASVSTSFCREAKRVAGLQQLVAREVACGDVLKKTDLGTWLSRDDVRSATESADAYRIAFMMHDDLEKAATWLEKSWELLQSKKRPVKGKPDTPEFRTGLGSAWMEAPLP